ncbi:hypothetical protein OH76DRAFT_1058815 [Lentinus brumalis]|uniref:BTB domain-containing protein n=1 Tax=Lentinus brumalis TaxID=2498619 RepID=A0A371DNC2_9APHY|nr:hypothetical protein OH76DRAFT_1058815 [Polyporus brumalis]
MSPASTSPASTNAQPPFDQPSADITLRTSDNTDFHVHSQILSQASPVFATMFELPQPKAPAAAAEVPVSRPVVDVAEDSTTLDALLRFCYPVKNPTLGSAEAVEPVLKAALKYDMGWATEQLTGRLLAIVQSSPLRVWAIGCRTKLEEVARRGAEAIVQSLPKGDTAELRVLPGISRASTDLEDLSFGDYQRCLSYINRRRAGLDPLSLLLRNSYPRRYSSDDSVAELMAELPFHDIPALDPGSSLPSPDIICMSSEGFAVRAHQSILSLHSPMLQKRITGLNNAASKSKTIPTLRIKEPADVLLYLLTLCYGEGGDCLPYDMHVLTSVLHAAKAYRMDRIIPAIESRWLSAAIMDPSLAYSAYLQAEIAGLKGYAKVAARIMVDTVARPYAWHSSLCDRVTAHIWHRFLTYHDSCQTAIHEELRWAKDRWEKTVLDGQSKGANRSMPNATRVSDYMGQLEIRLKDNPSAYRDCVSEIFSHCSQPTPNPLYLSAEKYASALYEFATTLPQKIEEAIDQVEWKY